MKRIGSISMILLLIIFFYFLIGSLVLAIFYDNFHLALRYFGIGIVGFTLMGVGVVIYSFIDTSNND